MAGGGVHVLGVVRDFWMHDGTSSMLGATEELVIIVLSSFLLMMLNKVAMGSKEIDNGG